MGLIVPLLFFLKGWLWHEITLESRYAIKQRNQIKPNQTKSKVSLLFEAKQGVRLGVGRSTTVLKKFGQRKEKLIFVYLSKILVNQPIWSI